MKKMKNIIAFGVASVAMLCTLTSCEDYLDKSPTSADDIEASDVFSDYDSISLFLDGGYRYLSNDLEYSSLGNQYSWSAGISDEVACVYNGHGLGTIHSGNWGAANIKGYEISDVGADGNTNGQASGTVIYRSYRTIRICNAIMQYYDQANMTPDQEQKILGQAYFLRAWSYFQLMRRYGGMPDLTQAHDNIQDYDQPRLTYHGSNEILIRDLDEAISRLPMEWDDANVGRATQVAAMAVKSMALLYDASPLMQNGLDQTVQQEHSAALSLICAKYTQSVIDYVNANPQVGRLSCTPGAVIGEQNNNGDYRNIFHWSSNHYSTDNGGNGQYFKNEEALWYNRDAAGDMSSTMRIFFLPQTWSSTGDAGGGWVYSYYAPTQNMVDMYEKKGADGNYYPITNSLSGYDVQSDGSVKNMYVDRDPRLSYNILLPGQTRGFNYKTGEPLENTYYWYYDASNTLQGAKMTKDASKQTFTSTREESGYVINKFIWYNGDNHGPFTGVAGDGWNLERAITVYIRVAHLYLNYAEAAYEATGSYSAIPEGCSLTAAEALNIIRRRAGITDWVPGSEDFEKAYQRERCVEFMFENSRWFDIRRWMTAEAIFADQYPLYGVVAIRSGYASALPAVGTTNGEEGSGEVAGFRNVTTEEGTFLKCTPKALMPETRVFAKRNYWYPFSTYDVDAMKNLQQNPGW